MRTPGEQRICRLEYQLTEAPELQQRWCCRLRIGWRTRQLSNKTPDRISFWHESVISFIAYYLHTAHSVKIIKTICDMITYGILSGLFLVINQWECGNECGYTLKKVMTAKLYCLLVWEPHILRFLRKKNSVLFGVLSLWATSKKHQLQKKKKVKNDTTTYQFIDMLRSVCGMKVLSKIFLNVFWESSLPDKIHKWDYDLQFFICCKLLPLDMPRVFSLK